MAASFQFLNDVALADLAFEAQGDSMEEVFQAATNAVIEVMANPLTVGETWERHIERQDQDAEALLFDWLSDLVYWKDAEGVVFSRARVAIVHEGEVWMLWATLFGEAVNQATQELRNDVKGVTKHLYRLAPRDGRWSATVVLDV